MRRGGIALTGFSGLPAVQARTSKLLQPNSFSAGVRPGSPQSGSIAGSPAAAVTARSASARLTAAGSAARLELGDPDRAGLGDEGRDRMREQDRRVGQNAAPVARMLARLPELDDEIEVERAAAAEEQGRLVGRETRAVGGEQQIGGQLRLMALADLAQPRRADLLAGLDQDLGIEAEALALGDDHAQSAARLIACWPLLSATPRP